MQGQSVLQSIARGVIAPVYLLYGQEEYLQEKVIIALKKAFMITESSAFNLDELEGNTVTIGTLLDLVNTLPVFAEKRLVIVQDFPLLQTGTKKESTVGEKQAEKRLLQYLQDPLCSTCLVFWQKEKIDKRRVFFKALVKNKHQVLNFEALRGSQLNQWVCAQLDKKGKSIEPAALNYLLFNCGNRLRDLDNELEKLTLYSGAETKITLTMVRELVVPSLEGNIFTLVDRLAEKKIEVALQELRNLLTLGGKPAYLLYMIGRQFRLILLVKALQEKGYTEKEITAQLGLHPFVTGKVRRQTVNYSFTELEKKLFLICATDFKLKNGFEPVALLENLLISLVV